MNSGLSVLQLSRFIRKLADEPTAVNRRLFHAALKQSAVGLRLVQPPAFVVHGQTRVIQPGDNQQVATTRGPDGKTMLLAYADVAEWHKADPSVKYGEVEANPALQMAVSGENAGIVINSIYQAWTAIPKADALAPLKEWK